MSKNKETFDFNLPTLDDLFSTQEERDDAKLERVKILPVNELVPFKDHPFKILDDEDMHKLVESIKEYGVYTPLMARPLPDGNGYELISGPVSYTHLDVYKRQKFIYRQMTPWWGYIS